MLRSNHYEVAFEAYLRVRGVGFVAVDEAKRSVLGDTDVKSLDFIVVGPETAKLVVDVKGRKFPTGTGAKAVPTWQNWAEGEDVDGLDRWAAQFGGGFRGVLAFVYDIRKPYQLGDGTRDVFPFRDHTYLMRGVAITEYRARRGVEGEGHGQAGGGQRPRSRGAGEGAGGFGVILRGRLPIPRPPIEWRHRGKNWSTARLPMRRP